ncbi:MAG: hypothetical protein ACE5JH_06130 [Acidobacteriota bacterium]
MIKRRGRRFPPAAALALFALTGYAAAGTHEHAIPGGVAGLDPQRDETDRLRAELKELSGLVEALSAGGEATALIEAKLRGLEEQIRQLREEVADLRSARLSEQGAPRTEEKPHHGGAPDVTTPPDAGDLAPPGELPAYPYTTSRKLNPAVGIIGNFNGAIGSSRGGSEAIAPLPSLALPESEASFQAAVDPFARADFFLAVGEEGIEVEEGYVSFPTIPGGFIAKVGRMRANFGKLNTFHNHTLPWVDRPIVMFNLLGGSTEDPDTGIRDAGVSFSWLAPTERLFLEASGEIFRGESGSLFQAAERNDVSLVGHLRSFADLSDASNIEAGISYARGTNEQGSGFLTQLYGVDLTFRWKPVQRATYRSFAARAELIWSRREELVETQEAFGYFVSADVRLNRRWFAGARYDWSERARLAAIHDSGASAVLTFWPSEFSQLRAQYRRTAYGEDDVANELLLQVLFTIGAHGAHPF